MDIGSSRGLSYFPLAQSAAEHGAGSPLDFLGLVAVLVLVALNGFFVAAEFALVSARKTRIDQLVAEGQGAAKAVQRSITHLNHVIASTQVGITLASLALGWVGEPAVARLVEGVFEIFIPGGVSNTIVDTIAIAIAFILITTFHIVLGELVPKTVALQKTEGVAMFVARPLELFRAVFKPFIWAINGLGSMVVRLFGMQVLGENAKVHSVEELELLVTESREAGFLDQQEEVLLRRVFDFGDKTARQVMIPRTEVVGVPEEATLNELINLVAEERFTRFPVYRGSLDKIVGVVHVKDIFGLIRSGFSPQQPNPTFKLTQIMRPVLNVPETLHVADLLPQMRQRQVHMAVIIDEYGGTAGIVTLEDILEELVGEVRDEFDTKEGGVPSEVEVLPDGTTLMSGLYLLQDAAERFGLEISEDELDEYDTVGGFIQGRLGRVPQVGDSTTIDGYILRVEQMDGLRVDRVSLRRREQAPTSKSGASKTAS